ncbi:hypothetical protein RclHR1_02660030 [Rhizophagus clarus]|uniref:Reverse transcriptase domain-containing protein n=1 Tax=Rhizophagus clarus TaxID=94130 RepID=A0A2Z6REN3_9GLOM|nr:hypothetical protein RclHR1_02660030 [Rhizophagus clarus]
MNRSNRVFTAHGDTSAYQVCIGIDQGEVISPLLWVIYIDPLLTVLKKEMLDPYVLRLSSLLPTPLDANSNLVINNLVFMDDSTLVSSSKSGLEHMLSITEEFYALNNTSANHHKYVLISNSLPLTTTSNISPFLGVWFNIKGSQDFIKKQIASKCNSFAATLRLAKLSAKQVVYLYNTVLIPKLEYHMQVTHLSVRDCYAATRHVRSLIKQKANFSRALPNPILYLFQALGLINLFSHLTQCHVNNLFLMANSTTSFIQRLFVYRLMLIQFQFLIPVFPLMVDDWSLWSNMITFNSDYIACTLTSMVSTPFRLQHASFTLTSPDLTLPGHTPLYSCMSSKTFKACLKTAYITQLADKCGRSLPHKWYLDIRANTTIPDSHDRLFERYVCSPSAAPGISLIPGITTNQKNRRWLVTLDGQAAPLFGKQLTVQPKKDTCIIVHWTSDCLSFPGDVIRLCPCSGCDAHVPLPAANKYTAVEPRCTFTVSLLRSLILPTDCERIRLSITVVVFPYSWADLCDQVVSYCNHLSISPDFSSSFFMVDDISPSSSLSRDSPGLPLPVLLPAEAAAIYAALCVTSEDSVASIYTDSQAAINGLRSCASSTYTNSRFYYKTTNFELWAAIERCIHAKRLSVLPVKVKEHDSNYWNNFADSLANSAHQSDDAFPLPKANITFTHTVRLVYADVTCESNPRRLFKTYYQATYMQDLLALKRFQFTLCLTDRDNYVVDWNLTWFTLNYSLTHDASFKACHASRHFTFKFKNHLFSKLREAGELADMDPTPMLRKLSSLSCWTISSSNWSSYALIRGCLPRLFIDLFVELSISRVSAMKVVAAIHNNFIQKLRTCIWNSCTYNKSKWEDAMNITLKLKTTPRPSNLPATSYVPFSSLSPSTHPVTSRDSGTDWIKNSMTQGLLCGRVIRYYVSIVASTLLSLFQSLVRASTNVMEPPTSEDLDSLMTLVSQNHTKANKLRNDLKKCRKLLLKLVTDLSIVSEPATHAQLITNVATLSRMILDGSFSLAELRRHIITDELASIDVNT